MRISVDDPAARRNVDALLDDNLFINNEYNLVTDIDGILDNQAG